MSFEEHVLSETIPQPEPAPASAPTSSDSNARTGADDEIRHWVEIAVEAAEAKLGQNTRAFNVGEIMAITDWFIITSGRTTRQVRAIVEAVEEELTRSGGPKPVRIEGKDTLSWVLMDYGIFVVHVFTEESREYYDLERLWTDVPRLDRAGV